MVCTILNTMTTNPFLQTLPTEEEIHDEAMHQAIEERDARIASLKARLAALTAERDAFRDDRNALVEEMDELMTLAAQAMRAPTMEERQMAASLVCARLVRPPVRKRDAEDEVVERAERECMNGGLF